MEQMPPNTPVIESKPGPAGWLAASLDQGGHQTQ